MNAVPNPPLTAREIQVVSLLAEGLNRKEIAAELNLSTKTIEYYINGNAGRSWAFGIFKKLGTNSVALVTQWALSNHLARWKV